jgi:hypothetical protein
MSVKYQANGNNLKTPDYSLIMFENTIFYGNSDHTSPLTYNCGFRKVEVCEISENVGSTKADSSIEVKFPVKDPISSKNMDYVLDVSNLLRYGIKTFEKVTYEHSALQLLYGVKEDGEKILLFFIGGKYNSYKFGVYFMDGLDDHTGMMYYTVKDPKTYNIITDDNDKTVAIMEFYYLGNPLNFIYFPKLYKEANSTIIRYPGEEDITGYKVGDMYLPNAYKIESDNIDIRSLDLIMRCIDDPHIKRFYIPIPFIAKMDNNQYPTIDFKSVSNLAYHKKGSIHNYLGVTYGKKDGNQYIPDYIELEYFESPLRYGIEVS